MANADPKDDGKKPQTPPKEPTKPPTDKKGWDPREKPEPKEPEKR